MTNPLTMNPLVQSMEFQRRSWERVADEVERLQELPEAMETTASIDVGHTESEVVYEENKLELLHYEPRTDEQREIPILIVYALINRPYILDLQPDRSVVRRLLEAGYDVYLIDWGEPSTLDRSIGLADYVDRYIDNCVDVVRERSGQDAISILGYCMGGSMSAMYAARFPEKVENLALMAAGLCFAGQGGVLERWGDEEYFDPESVVETFDNVPAEFLDVGFALMDPVQNHVTKYVHFYENLEDEEFVENFARMERWVNDGIDVAGQAYVEFLREVYQQNCLYRNELELDGEPVDVEEIDMPLLQIVAEYDHLIPPGASKPFNEVVTTDDTEILEFPTGHIGMSVSSSSHAELWPDVIEWFDQRSGELRPVEERHGTEGDGTEIESDAADSETTPASDPIDALTAIDGVGPTYAERLVAAGVESVADLAAADAGTLADAADIPAGRLETLIETARSH